MVKCQSPVGKTYTANVFGPVITQCRHTGEVYLGRSLHTIKAKLVKLSSPVESSKWGTWAGHDTVCLKCQTGDHLQWKVASALGQVMTQYVLKAKLVKASSPAASSECPWVGHDTVCLKGQTGEVIIISSGK